MKTICIDEKTISLVSDFISKFIHFNCSNGNDKIDGCYVTCFAKDAGLDIINLNVVCSDLDFKVQYSNELIQEIFLQTGIKLRVCTTSTDFLLRYGKELFFDFKEQLKSGSIIYDPKRLLQMALKKHNSNDAIVTLESKGAVYTEPPIMIKEPELCVDEEKDFLGDIDTSKDIFIINGDSDSICNEFVSYINFDSKIVEFDPKKRTKEIANFITWRQGVKDEIDPKFVDDLYQLLSQYDDILFGNMLKLIDSYKSNDLPYLFIGVSDDNDIMGVADKLGARTIHLKTCDGVEVDTSKYDFVVEAKSSDELCRCARTFVKMKNIPEYSTGNGTVVIAATGCLDSEQPKVYVRKATDSK